LIQQVVVSIDPLFETTKRLLIPVIPVSFRVMLVRFV